MKQNNKVAVILHLYHTDLWPELQSLLINFSKDIKLYLSLNIKDKNNTNLINQINCNFLTSITYHDNFGADVAPFIQQICEVDEPYFIKIHSKKSVFGVYDQINWRKILLHDLLGSKNLFYNNLKKISQNSKIGIVGNKNLLLKNNESSHSLKIQTLCDLIHLEYNKIKPKNFFGGNMFLSRTELFQQHFLPYKNELLDLLKNEKGKVDETPDGTYSHSLERLFGYIVSYNNLKFEFSNPSYIKIKNSLAPKGYFHMIKLYDNDCYLTEDLHVYGKILEYQPNAFMSIKWQHINNSNIQYYKFISKNSIIKT
jgi:lipopolysaccharide biosynthesis protein